MIYNILCNGVNIYDASPELGLLNPQLDKEINAAGSLTFTVLPTHIRYNDIQPFTSDIEVYEGEDLLFYGRVIDTTVDFLNRKKVTCEGALGFFNDTIQYPKIFAKPDPSDPDDNNQEILLSEFVEYLIAEHNKQVTLPNRHFKMGRFTMTDKKVSRELDYHKTMDCIKTMCVDAEGGYVFARKEDDGVYLDWMPILPGVSSQPIQYALNLTDLTQDFKGSTLVTSVIPIGKDDLNLRSLNPDGTYTEVNIRNPGQLYVDSDAVTTYGRIVEKVDFSDIDDKQQLYDQAVKWLADNQFEAMSVNVSAADLSYFNPEYSDYKLGETVHVTSYPHLIDKDYPIVKISYKLDKPTKNITIGTVPRQSLTQIYSSGGGGGSKNSVSKSQAKRIATSVTDKAIENIDYVDKIYQNLDLKIDETDHTIHTYFGDNPEDDENLLLDTTGYAWAEVLDDIADKLEHITEHLEPETDEEEP